MPNDSPQSRLELVEALASSIQKKLVEPVEDRMEIVIREIGGLNERVAALEEKAALLSARLSRTRLLACISLVMAALLALARIFLDIR